MSRQLKWVSSVSGENEVELRKLEERMVLYYRRNGQYYDDISFGESAWQTDPYYKIIANNIIDGARVLEVGCGRASVIETFESSAVDYTGIDFSEDLLNGNRLRHKGARFEIIRDSRRFPVESGVFDVVFSVYVIEHTVFPAAFLEECYRVARRGGTIIVYCPNFLGRGWVTSQRVGFRRGGARTKLRRGSLFDGLVSYYDRAVRIPKECERLRRDALNGRGFFVNLEPICFEDPFFPDADATYLTYAPEMLRYLGSRVALMEGSRIADSGHQYFVIVRKL